MERRGRDVKSQKPSVAAGGGGDGPADTDC